MSIFQKILVGLVLVSSLDLAWAGLAFDSSWPVQVTGSRASGTLSAARSYSDPSHYIGCSIIGYANSDRVRLYCSAQGDTHLACYRYNPPEEMLKAVESIGPNSFLIFRKEVTSSECVGISVKQHSGHLP